MRQFLGRSRIWRSPVSRALSVTRADSVIELHNVSCKLPDGRTLFTDVNVSLLSKTFVGVGKMLFRENPNASFLRCLNAPVAVGPNGAGKSTFLKLLAGIGTYEGRVSVRPGTKVTYLAQEPELDESLDVRGNVAAGVNAS